MSEIADLPPGSLLCDTYLVREVLGRGGMATVYGALDQRLDRAVALKVPKVGTDQEVLRLEGRALAALRHPGLPVVHALASHTGSVGGPANHARHESFSFLVMERILGIDLWHHLRRLRKAGEQIGIAEALSILVRLADVLGFVHAAGVAHRDVKPSNVMLAPGGRVVLTDFGLMLAEASTHRSVDAAGTPEYLAPEGISRNIGEGAAHLLDVYAFGVLAFETLIGTPPFSGGTVVELLKKQLTVKPPEVISVRPDVPESLSNLITRMLDKSATERPTSMEVVAQELRGIAVGEKPSSRPMSRSLTILVVDDEAPIRKLVASLARSVRAGCEVLEAADAEEALTLLRNRSPDVLVVDLRMPRMSGIELCMYLRGAGFSSRIIAMSASAQEDDVMLLGRLGIGEYVPKGEGFAQNMAKRLSAPR